MKVYSVTLWLDPARQKRNVVVFVKCLSWPVCSITCKTCLLRTKNTKKMSVTINDLCRNACPSYTECMSPLPPCSYPGN